MHPRVRELIDGHQLRPLPVESTLFCSTYRSRDNLPGGAPMGTGMIGLYAAEPESHSMFHRLTSDELWHFYEGDPLRLVLLYPDGRSEEVRLGPDGRSGQYRQYLVPAQTWQAGSVTDGGQYALFGCTMSPGFTSSGFEGGLRGELLARYPQRRADILHFTSEHGETRMPEGFAT